MRQSTDALKHDKKMIPCPIMMSLAHDLLPALNTRRCNGVEFSTVLANLMVLDAEY